MIAEKILRAKLKMNHTPSMLLRNKKRLMNDDESFGLELLNGLR